MLKLQSWWEQRAERRGAHRRYRAARRNWIGERVRSRLAPRSLGFSVVLGLSGVLVYWVWSRVQRTAFDPFGSFLALVIPPAIYVGGTWLYYRMNAPAQLFEEQRRQLEQFNPPPPWAVAIEVAEQDRRITIRLVPRHGVTGTMMVDSATCFVEVGNIRPTCHTPKSGPVSETQALEWHYPAEFDKAIWPLPDGTHPVVVQSITSPSTPSTIHNVGAPIQIGRTTWWARLRGDT